MCGFCWGYLDHFYAILALALSPFRSILLFGYFVTVSGIFSCTFWVLKVTLMLIFCVFWPISFLNYFWSIFRWFLTTHMTWKRFLTKNWTYFKFWINNFYKFKKPWLSYFVKIVQNPILLINVSKMAKMASFKPGMARMARMAALGGYVRKVS